MKCYQTSFAIQTLHRFRQHLQSAESEQVKLISLKSAAHCNLASSAMRTFYFQRLLCKGSWKGAIWSCGRSSHENMVEMLTTKYTSEYGSHSVQGNHLNLNMETSSLDHTVTYQIRTYISSHRNRSFEETDRAC